MSPRYSLDDDSRPANDITQDMDRRAELVKIFGTNILAYYNQHDSGRIGDAIATFPPIVKSKVTTAKGDKTYIAYTDAKQCLIDADVEIKKLIDEVKRLIDAADSPGNKALFALKPMQADKYKEEISQKIYDAQQHAIDAIAKSESIRASVNYDCMIFLNLDYVKNDLGGYGLGVGYRKKQENYRLASTVPTTTTHGSVTVDTYNLYNDPGKRYIEIFLSKESDLTTDIPEFKYLNLNSKLMVSGHGHYEIDFVQTDGQNKTVKGNDIHIDKLAEFISKNITAFSPQKFNTHISPLKISFFSCCSAGLNADGVYSDAGTGQLLTKAKKPVELANTMAGRLLSELKKKGIFAVIKARTTPVASVKTKIRSEPVSALHPSVSSSDSPISVATLYDGTPQSHRGVGFIKNDIKNTVKAGMNNHPFTKKYGFQGTAHRVPGYKFVFKWDNTGRMNVVDIANNSEIDPFFEIQKDRIIQYLYGTAFYVEDEYKGVAAASDKRKAILNIAYSIEKAHDLTALRAAVQMATENAQVNKHMSTFLYAIGKTRTRKVLDWLLKSLTERPKDLIPAPNWDERKLGLDL